MDCSPLARLPKELRLTIYEYALTQNFAISIRPFIWRSPNERYQTVRLDIETVDNSSEPNAGPDLPYPLALPSTCRQLRREALPVFYSVNELSIISSPAVYSRSLLLQCALLRDWIRSLGDISTTSFRHVNISVRVPQAHSPRVKAIEIYARYLELAVCFDANVTKIDLDLAGLWMPKITSESRGSLQWHAVRNVFTLTPWAGLQGQIDRRVDELEARLRALREALASGRVVAKNSDRLAEREAQGCCELLRHLAEFVEKNERSGDAVRR